MILFSGWYEVMRNAQAQQEHCVLFRSLLVRYAISAWSERSIIGKLPQA
ncbi:hypothetical protein BDSB_04260 [Burkholderia dolosa PC543]|nr:hypothetical protein BDSB_04260 [Burkholderia dolosa PC543]